MRVFSKYIIALLITSMLIVFSACGIVSNAIKSTVASTPEAAVTESPAPPVLDLTGDWKQTNSGYPTVYQLATISGNTIEINWVVEGRDPPNLYWAGSYIAPTTSSEDYSWDSVNDKAKTGSMKYASSEDTKSFTYKNGIISYPVSFEGTTATLTLARQKSSDASGSSKGEPAKNGEIKPLEIVESAYFLLDGHDEYYIQYAFVIKNPNTDKAVYLPKVRLTARDASGNVLGTRDIVGLSVLPESSWISAFQGPSVESEPATVEFEVIAPDDYHWKSPESIKYFGKPLSVENLSKGKKKITGEVSNPNDFDIGSVAVIILYRDENGMLIAGDTEYTDKVTSGGKVPFEISISYRDYVTDNFEVYAYPWQ